jgi:hypothetical protein
MGRKKKDGNYTPQKKKNSIEDLVENDTQFLTPTKQ